MASNSGCVEMQDTGNLWDVKHTCGQAGSPLSCGIKACLHRRRSGRARAPVDTVAGGGAAPSDPVGLGQAEPGSGLVPLRERGVQGMAVGAHKCRYTCAYSHTLRCRVLSLSVSLEYCVCVCVCVCARVRVSVYIYQWQFHHPHSRIRSSVARSSLQPGCVSNWHSNWQIWMPPLDG